jgi:hypothetical protein
VFGGYLCQCYGVTKPETVDDLLDVHWTFCLTNTIAGPSRTLARLGVTDKVTKSIIKESEC